MRRREMILGIMAAAWLGNLGLAGCGSEMSQKIVSTFFDSTDKPPVPTRRVRRDLLQENADLKRQVASAQTAASNAGSSPQEAARPVERAKTWEQAAELLPKDSDGNVDWVKALKEGVINPQPGPSRTSPQHALVSFDVTLVPEGDEESKAVFSHEVHTTLLACSSCHPSPFQMKAGADTISMDQIDAGKSCGVCHSKVAFPSERCPRCHPAMEE